MGRGRRSARHDRLAVPGDPPPAVEAAPELITESAATAVGGGLLAGATWSLIGLGWPAAIVGALNGAICGARGTYGWRHRRGPLAFVLDSTWALPMTAAALLTHGVAAVQRGRGGYVTELSRRADRHVYARGFRIRPGFLVTIGNVVHGARDDALTSARRRRLVTDHEDVHIWQARWFGPLYPILYASWMVVGGAVGAVLWLARGRREPLGRVVETCGYYLNPFEWWAYTRGGSWPPTKKVAGLGWSRACVRPLRSVGFGSQPSCSPHLRSSPPPLRSDARPPGNAPDS